MHIVVWEQMTTFTTADTDITRENTNAAVCQNLVWQDHYIGL
jgi:hypothetical protein